MCSWKGFVKYDLERRTESFVIRIWAEYLDQIPASWRGEAEHVGSQLLIRFTEQGELLEFIHAMAMERSSGQKKVCEG